MAGIVRGYIVRSENGAPIRSAAVVMRRARGPGPERMTSTRDDGSFLIDGLTPGPWTVVVRPPDGSRGESSVHVHDNSVAALTVEVGEGEGRAFEPKASAADNNPAVVQSRLSGERVMTGSIRGCVVGENSHRPVADAAIRLASDTMRPPTNLPRTDSQGRFAIDGLPEGLWMVTAESPTGDTAMGMVRVENRAATDVLLEMVEAEEGQAGGTQPEGPDRYDNPSPRRF